jgi:hypothetical protein
MRMFRQVNLPESGVAEVDMRYLPATFRLGLYAFCLAFTAVFAVSAAYLRRLGYR